MAKRTVSKSRQKDALRSFDVYEQVDGSLIAMDAGDIPENQEEEPVWSGEATDEREAIAATRKSNKAYRKAPTALPEQEPDMPDSVRENAEQATNERLGINKRSVKKSGRKKSAAKSGTKKGAVKRATKKVAVRKKR